MQEIAAGSEMRSAAAKPLTTPEQMAEESGLQWGSQASFALWQATTHRSQPERLPPKLARGALPPLDPPAQGAV